MQHAPQPTPSKRQRRGISIVPFVGDLLVLSRLLRDPKAHWALKALTIVALAYVISPIDAVPEAVLPVIGFFDDIGLIVGLRLLLDKRLTPYRYPLFGAAPVRDDRSPQSTVGAESYGASG